MNDGMEIYRAYLSAQKLAEELLAAHHDRHARKHFLEAASKELNTARDRLDTAILTHIKPHAAA